MTTEYPYYAVKGPDGKVLLFTASTSARMAENSIMNRDGIVSWESYRRSGYSIVRVAIVEEPKE